jgi:hypothetical protein
MTTLTDLNNSVNALNTVHTASFQASVDLRTSVSADIATAITDADTNVIIPVMAMYSNQQLMANSMANINASFITLITPPEA